MNITLLSVKTIIESGVILCQTKISSTRMNRIKRTSRIRIIRTKTNRIKRMNKTKKITINFV